MAPATARLELWRVSTLDSHPRIRVLVSGTRGIVADIVRNTVAAQPDFELVLGEDPHPDVVIVQNGQSGNAEASRMLWSHPESKVILISGDARRADVLELAPTRQALGELSPQSLVNAVRAAARRR
jgi:DNA-binding NarL/FixJ family response regulator